MVATTYGFDGNIDATAWSTLSPVMMQANGSQVITAGHVVTATGVTRQVSVSGTGEGWAAGVYFTDSAATTLFTLDAQASGTRRDYIVRRLSWSAKTALLAVVKGSDSNGTTPALTQTNGSLWEIPVATVDVTSSGMVINQRVPLPKVPRVFVASSFTIRTGAGYQAAPLVVATIVPGDPGWPYRLRVDGTVLFGSTGSGAGLLSASLSANGSNPFVVGRSDPLNNASSTAKHPVRVSGTSGVVSGLASVRLFVQPAGLSAGDTLDMVSDPTTMFQVEQIPA